MNYWLPKLKQDANLGDGNKDSGKFLLMNHGVRTLADTIEVPPGNQLKIRSIPDVWARAMLYQDVFTTNFNNGNNTPQYIKGFIGQWRGLLAAIVLREHYGLNIGFNPINFTDASGSFIDDVKILLPNAGQVLPGVNWNSPTLLILTYKDIQGNAKKVPLGMTSPSTLLYPAPPSDDISNIDWYSAQTGFSDPIGKLTTADKYVLYCWLIWVSAQIPNAATQLQKVIEEYRADLAMSLGNALIDGGKLNNATVTFAPMGGNNDLAVQLLGAQYSSNGNDSNFNLDRDNSVIVLPQDEAAPETKFVFGIYDFYSYNKNSVYKMYIKRKIIKEGKKIFERDDIFFDKVVYFRSDEAKKNTPAISQKVDFYVSKGADGSLQVNTEPQGTTKSAVVLPVREGVIPYLNDSQIVVIKNTIVASVVFSVANGQVIELSRAFAAKKTVQLDNLPMTAVWPNVDIPNWTFYYLFARQTTQNGKNYLFSGHGAAGRNKSVTRLNLFPQYLILNENHEPVGYIPLKPVALVNALHTSTMNIGIDFGTSSSTVYWSVTNANGGIQQTSPLTFDSNLAVVSCGTQEVKSLVREFMTPFANPIPFPTLLNVHDNQNLDPANIFESSNNFYFKSMTERNDEDLSGMKGQIKWDPNTNSASSFIGQLILQAALFARKGGYTNTKWLFSYPLSLRNPANFQNACGRACNALLQGTGLNNNIQVSYKTESEASAEYFLNTNAYANVAPPILIVDIGGGSTDIYLHVAGQNNSLQSSLSIGAREMLIELLRGKSDYFHQKLTALVAAGNGINGITNNRIDTSQAFATFANQGNPDEFTVFVETTFDINFNQASKLGDKLCDAVVSSNPTTDTGSVYLRSIIMLYLSAIFYYCGMLIRYSEQISNQNISICIAGNGSKIVNWVRSNLQDALTNMGGGVPGPGGIADVLSGFICSGADINQQNMQFIWSGQPKEEVSCGLVHDVGIAAGGGQAQEVILSGITGIMNDQLVSPNSNLVNLIVNTQDGQEKLTWQQMNGFDEVKAFLNLYNAIPAGFNLKKIQINDHFANVNGQNNVVQILDNTVKTNTQDNTNGRRSPFIVAIQQISREILAQWH